MSKVKKFQDYGLSVHPQTKREMWFKKGKLTRVSEVPEHVQKHLRGEEKPAKKQEVNKSTLYGFTDDTTRNDSDAKEKASNEREAVKILKNEYPEFDFKVEYQAGYKKGDIMIKPRYQIFVLVGDVLQKTVRISEFSMNEIRENLQGVLEGWKETGRRRAPRRGEKLTQELKHGETEKEHLRKVNVPKNSV